MQVPDTTLAWLAALIDADGSVMLTKHKTRTNMVRVRPVVSISNTNYLLMEALVEKTSTGQVYTHIRPVKENHKKVAYTWRLNATQLREWLPRLIPWLILKREQAVLVQEYLELADVMSPSKGMGRPSTSNPRKLELSDQVSELNRKGRHHSE